MHATTGTRDLCAILLPDSGHLQEEDAAFLNRHQLSQHAPALPLYTRLDALHCLKQFRTHAFHKAFEPIPGWRATFYAGRAYPGRGQRAAGSGRAAHSVLGRPGPSRRPADEPARGAAPADTVLVESTYGDRQHPQEDILARAGPRPATPGRSAAAWPWCRCLPWGGRRPAARHRLLKKQGTIAASLPVFLDSPMAVSTTGLFSAPPGRAPADREGNAMAHAATMVQTTERIQGPGERRHGPMVILSASGMATGGRVLHHLALYAGDHRNMIILTGYQARARAARALPRRKDHPHPRQEVEVARRGGATPVRLGPRRRQPDCSTGCADGGMRPTGCMWCTVTWARPTCCASASMIDEEKCHHPSVEWSLFAINTEVFGLTLKRPLE
jgi:metallo-beta-lactamase family protein